MANRAKYNQLVQSLKKIRTLQSVSELLSWDQQVVMPTNGGAARGLQLQELAGIIYDQQTSPALGQLLSEISVDELDNEYERANVILAQKAYDRKTRIPKELVEKQARLSSEGYETWAKAKEANDWSMFAPILKELIQVTKQTAVCIDPNANVYDVMLEEYETGLTQEKIDRVFEEVKIFLIPFIKKIFSSDKKFIDLNHGAVFNIDKQMELNKRIAKEIGYNFDSGRIDVSAHPFSTTIGVRDDIRITTRYRSDEFLQGLSGTIHECGHAMYEQNLNAEHAGTPAAEPMGMGVHESQSLFWERHVGLSKPFWKHYWPILNQEFGLNSKHSYEQIYEACNTVKAEFIRVESDEVTYPLHIVLRYEIERGLFDGTISVDDLPRVWNEKFEQYLGMKPPTDAKGVLQDIHWSAGAFGYFATYLLGAIYAAQIAASIKNLDQLIEERNFVQIRKELTEKVHTRGSADLTVDNLLKHATGEPLSSKYFIDYITDKYTGIYKL